MRTCADVRLGSGVTGYTDSHQMAAPGLTGSGGLAHKFDLDQPISFLCRTQTPSHRGGLASHHGFVPLFSSTQTVTHDGSFFPPCEHLSVLEAMGSRTIQTRTMQLLMTQMWMLEMRLQIQI